MTSCIYLLNYIWSRAVHKKSLCIIWTTLLICSQMRVGGVWRGDTYLSLEFYILKIFVILGFLMQMYICINLMPITPGLGHSRVTSYASTSVSILWNLILQLTASSLSPHSGYVLSISDILIDVDVMTIRYWHSCNFMYVVKLNPSHSATGETTDKRDISPFSDKLNKYINQPVHGGLVSGALFTVRLCKNSTYSGRISTVARLMH